MSNPRKCSIPTRDVNIVLEDSFDEFELCIHFSYIRIRDKFCLEIIPRTVFIFHFHSKNQIFFSFKERVYVKLN